jgi:hypothetical protein
MDEQASHYRDQDTPTKPFSCFSDMGNHPLSPHVSTATNGGVSHATCDGVALANRCTIWSDHSANLCSSFCC